MTSPAQPIVSVIIAAYNAHLILETLHSVSNQTMPEFEVLVVDDCSTDNTREVVAAYPDPRVRLIQVAKNGGPIHARNRGVAEARGRYIAGLDHDDLCRPERFARQVAYLDANPEVALVGAQTEYLCDGRIGLSGYPVVTTPALIEWLIQIENPLVWSSTMFRASAAHALDPFTRPEILYSEDLDLYHRIRAHGRVARLDDTLTTYRQHSGSLSRRFTDTMRASAIQVMTEAHGAVLGDEAAPVARLLAYHVMGGEPVPDRATLDQLGRALGTLQRDFLDKHQVNGESRRLIQWETAQRWGRIGRAGLRAGTLTLGDVLAARPDHLGLGYAGLDALLWSGAIGRVRRARAAVRASR